MIEKTSRDESLQKTNKTISRFLIVIIFSAVFFSLVVPAEATHLGTNVVVFTDKRVYNPFTLDLDQGGGTPTYESDLSADFSIYVYAMVLDERGMIMKGREGLLTGTLVDQKEYRHTSASNHIGATVNNPGIVGSKTLSFVDDGSVNGDIAGDGIYTTVVDMPENIGTSMVAVTDELLINVTVTDPQAGSGYTDVLVAGFSCMQPKVDYGSAFNAHVSSSSANSDNCVVCHRAYEHFFENISGAIDYKYLDGHFKNATARSRVTDPLHTNIKNSKNFDLSFRWNLSDYAGSYSSRTLEEMAPGSSFCYFCHTYNYTVAPMKYGDQRDDLTQIPSCNNSNCHSTTKIGGNAVPAWSPASAAAIATPSMSSPNYNISRAQQHAHDNTGGDTVPCATCHGTVHGLQIPNSTSTDYNDLALRCLSCHAEFSKHNSTVSCIKCHENDVHNIRFLQQDETYNWSRSNIVTCDNCHTGTSFPGNLSLSPPQVPYTNHSGDSMSGQKWGDYWTSVDQSDAVNGSNLITTQTVVVSSESALVGTTSGFSNVSAENGSYETLTEGWALTIDEYRYVDSTSDTFGTVTNLANAQNSSDSEAYATFTSSSGSVTNQTFFGYLIATTGTNGEYAELIDGLTATTNKKYVTIGNYEGLNNLYGISNVYACMKVSTGDGTETFTLTQNKGSIQLVATSVPSALTEYCVDITADISAPSDLTTIEITATETAAGGDSGGNVDAVWLQVSYSPTEAVNIVPSVIGAKADVYYFEMNYYTSGDTFDVLVYNGTRWVDKGDLTQTGSFAVFNVSLAADEHNEGSPQIKIMDKTADATVDYLYIDYLRIHSYTGGSSAASNHYELILNHNFTGIPKYAASEVSEYTVLVKGYVTASENLHIYAYDYGSNSYQLVKDNAFPTTNSWVNYTIPYTAISNSGNASIQFVDVNQTSDDDTAYNFYIDYVAIKADNNKYLPCYYCHSLLANHKVRALGNIEWIQGGFDTPNPMNSTDLANTYWCANCHYNGSSPVGRYKYNGTAWSPAPPRIDTDNTNPNPNSTQSWVQHDVASNFTDAKCQECHGSAAILTTKDALHNVSEGTGGGNNCLQCHDLEAGYNGPSAGINFTAANLSVHFGMNSNNATSAGFAPVIGACWACHDTDGNVSSGHPDLYTTPKTCTDCHLASGTYYSQTVGWGGLTVSEHYYSGDQIAAGNSSSDIGSCINCHEIGEMVYYNNDTDTGSFSGDSVRLTGGNLSYYHYGNNKSTWTPDTNAYCNNCHNNASTAFPFGNPANKTIANHSSNYPSSNPDCKDCHSTGKIHNSTLDKPALTLQNSSFCLNCHGSGGSATINNLERHNGASGLNCTQCHLNSTSSIHPVRYLQQDNTTWAITNTSAVNCTTCHQNSGLGGDFASAPIIPTPVNHSTNTYSGALWNGAQSAYWDNTSQQSTCDFCHTSSALHNSSGLGKVPVGNNSKNVSLTGSYWCANCHYSATSNYSVSQYGSEPPEVTNSSGFVPATANDGTPFKNHSGDLTSQSDDDKCSGCHDNGATNTLEFSHNVGEGGGGPDCISCHDAGQSPPASGALVNFTAMNSTGSLHKDLNKDVSTALNAQNKKCWACHGDGTEPSGHPSRYKTPYACVDCHEPDGTQNLNYTPSDTVLNVTQHFWNGTSINTAAVTSSCYDCHNKTEMMLGTNLDPDGAASFGGANGGNNSVNHYGKKRTDYPTEGTNAYCNQCHNNGSTVFPFADDNNKTIANHSANYPASNPDCDDCHSTGRIHNSTLNKPSDPVGNGTYCLSCHGNDGAGATNFTGAVTTYKEEHNGSKCTECHLNSSRSIHPVRYLQQDNTTWTTTSTGAVNCTTCHQDSGLGGDFASAPIVPTPMYHSTDTYSGGLWNGSQPAYWDNTSQQSSCDFCHGTSASLHNNSGLGNITIVQGSNTKKMALSNSRWCANCHYADAPEYAGTSLTLEPPEIMNASGNVPTTSSSGQDFKNHSTYLSSGYNDSNCQSCHNNNLDGGATSLNMSHNVAIGVAGGANCTNCHNVDKSAPAPGALVNITAMNNSGALHSNLNIDASTSLPAENKKCWACHGDGTEPSGHPSKYKTPYTCVDCHEADGTQNFNYTPNNTILNVTQHFWNGTSINTAAVTSCYDCHNKTEMMLGTNLDPDGADININGGANGGNGSVSHYGKKRTDYPTEGTNAYCNQCHNNGSTVFPFADNNNKTIANHSSNYPASNPDCDDCHSTGRIHNSTLTKPSDPVGNGTYCLSCHGNNGSGATNFTGAVTTFKEEHNSSKCTECHLNSSRSIHPVRYLNQDNTTWATTSTGAVNCTTCHQDSGLGGDFASAPIMPTPIWHSNSSYNGSRWNGTLPAFWDNTSLQTSCDYCHGDVAIHNNSGLGNITLIQNGNQKNQSISGTSYWCANCHYNGSSPTGNYEYKGYLFDPVPPEIINKTGLVPANATDGMPFQNHTDNVGVSHDDARCKNCHLSDATTTGIFAHKLNESQPEAGGKDCLSCHDINANDPQGPPTNRRVNGTAFTNYSVHKNLNSNANLSASMSFNNASVACWACHGDGTQPAKHPAQYITPKACEVCHVDNAFSAPLVYQHYPGSVFIGSRVYDSTSSNRTCASCHNNSVVDNLGLSIDSYSATKLKNATASHYAVNYSFGNDTNNSDIVTEGLPDTTQMLGCRQCHKANGVGGTRSNYGNARTVYSHGIMGSSEEECEKACHNTQPVAVTLHNQSIGIYVNSNACYSTGCHTDPASGGGTRRR